MFPQLNRPDRLSRYMTTCKNALTLNILTVGGFITLIDAPKIIVFAGPNGSGKSTVTQAWDKAGLYINADDIKAMRGAKFAPIIIGR